MKTVGTRFLSATVLFLIGLLPTMAQDITLRTSSNKERIDSLLQLADKHVYSQPERTITLATAANELAQQEADLIYLRAKSLSRLGAGYWSKGELLNALNQLCLSNQTADSIEATDIRARNLGFAGNIYSMAGDEVNARYYYHKALKDFLIAGNQDRIFAMYNNIGKSYLDSDQLDSARVYLYQAEKELIEPLFKFLPIALFNLGELEFKSKHYQKADSLLALTWLEAERNDDLRARTRVLQTQSELHLVRSEVDQAHNKALRAYEEAGKTKVKELLQVTSATLSKSFAQKGEFEQAYAYQQLAQQYQDSLDNQMVQYQLELNQFNENRLEVEMLTQKNQLSEAKAASRQQLVIVLFVVFLVSLLMIFLLARKNSEIREQRTKLEELDNFKTKMFAIVAHDLRSPITTLSQLAESLNGNLLTKDDLSNLLPPITRKIQNLNGIVENLFEWARSNMNGQTLDVSAFNLHAMADELTVSMRYLTYKKQIGVKNCISEDLILESDKRLTTIIIRNLLANAIKFSNAGGQVEIGAVKNGVKTVFSVKDYGVGMSEEQQQQLFSHELTHHAGTSGELGSGFGLIACSDFVQRLGGEIWATSKISEGSTFYFSIPERKVA